MPFLQASSPLKPIKNVSLLAHQKDAVTWMHNREAVSEYGIRGGILSDHMGLGKTFSIMGCIHYGLKDSNNLIIVPLAMVSTWVNTFKEYNFSVYSLNKNKEFYRHSYGANAVYIMHYNAIAKMSWRLHSILWTRIIIDEAHTIRNAKSMIFQHLMTFSATCKWIVTATPLINSIKDLINLFKWLGYTHTGGLMQFIELYKLDFMDKFVLRRTIKDIPALAGNIAEASVREINVPLNDVEIDLYESIISCAAPSLLALLSEDVNEEPETASDDEEIEKSLVAESAVESTVESAAESAVESEEKSDDISYDSSLGLIHSLHYLSISPSLLTPYIDYTESSKLMKMVEIMEDFKKENKSTIVFCQFRKEIDLVKRVMVDCGICREKNVFVLDGSLSSAERDKVLVDMKLMVDAGEFVVLLLQLKSGACGLNLQYFGAVVFINKWWNQPIIDQAIGRVVRIGSMGVKDIVFLVAERGYDVLVNNVLERKAMSACGIKY